MRKIKFRLIRSNKIVGYEEHRYINNPMNLRESSIYIYHSHTGHEMSWKCVSMNEKDYIKHDNKNQYIGLKDKNGKEIYGGDIVNLKKHRLSEDKHKQIVEWDEDMAGFNPFITHIYYDTWSIDKLNVEIIGNIYENPELLEK